MFFLFLYGDRTTITKVIRNYAVEQDYSLQTVQIALLLLRGLSIQGVSRSIRAESPLFANGCDMILEQIGIVCHRR